MKKIYITLFAVGIVSTSFSQVVLQASDINPIIGESFDYNRTDWIDPGLGGSNVTWDLSAMNTTLSSTLDIIAPSASFPAANAGHSEATGGIYYQENNASGQFAHGVDANGTLITFQNAMQIMAFPLNSSTLVNDTHSGTFTSGAYAFVRSGTTTIEVDGYGTLITPDGTFTDVIRVRLDQVYTDVYSMGSYDYNTVVYQWFKAGIHHPLATTTTFDSDLGYIEYGSYLLTAGLGIESNSSVNFSVYPNPASSELNLRSDANIATVEIFDALGNVVATKDVSGFNLVSAINISDLTAGIYFVKGITSEGVESKMVRVVKN